MPERSLLLVAAYGVRLGARHALEPDHLAAVSTMAAHGRSRSAVLRVAGAWGAGHATLVAVLGLLLTLLKLEIPDGLAGRADQVIAPKANAAVLYLLCFATGSIAGMLSVGALGLWPLFWAASSTAAARRLVQGLAGAASVVVGLLLAHGAL